MSHKNRFVTGILLLAAVFTVILALSTASATPVTAQGGGTAIPTGPFPAAITDQFSGARQNPYTGYMRVTDDHESISMQVPVEWNDIETGRWIVGGRDVGIFVAASPNLDQFYNSDSMPGVFFGASHDLMNHPRVTNPALQLNPSVARLLSDEGRIRQGRCQASGRFDYQDDFFRGQYDFYQNCNRRGQSELIVVTTPAHQEIVTLLRIGITSQADLAAAAHILDTYQVLNTRLADEHDD